MLIYKAVSYVAMLESNDNVNGSKLPVSCNGRLHFYNLFKLMSISKPNKFTETNIKRHNSYYCDFFIKLYNTDMNEIF